MKKGLIIASALLFMHGAMFAQKDVIGLLGAGLADAKTLSQAYMQPYGEMLGVNLNSGWYNSASVHKVGGFDFTIMGSYTKAPSSAETYDISSLGLTNFEVASGPSIGPTMAGKMENRPMLTPKTSFPTGASFEIPNGTGSNYFVSPMIQAGVGLPFHTELMGRFMPKVSMPGVGSVGLWGIGVKHSLKDYVPFFKRVPFLQVSALMAITQFSGSLPLPKNIDPITTTDANLDIKSHAFTSRLLVGANFPVIAFYTGFGYGNAKSDFGLLGKYSGIPGQTEVTDPFSLSYKNSNFDMNVGMRLRLGIIAFHVDYSLGKYSVVNAGMGLSFR